MRKWGSSEWVPECSDPGCYGDGPGRNAAPIHSGASQVALTEWNHEVQAFALNRTDEPFADRIRSRPAHRRSKHPHALPTHGSCPDLWRRPDHESGIDSSGLWGLPLEIAAASGPARRMTHDYQRNTTTTLLAALNTLDGSVIGTCLPRHTPQEWLRFLRFDPAPNSARQTGSSNRGQLLPSQARRSETLAAAPPAIPPPFHAPLRVVAEDGGEILSRPHRPTDSPRCVA